MIGSSSSAPHPIAAIATSTVSATSPLRIPAPVPEPLSCPYDVTAAEIEDVLAALVKGGWVAAGTVVVVERGSSGPSLTWPAGWNAWPARRYGDTRLELAVVDVAPDAAPVRN